MSNSMKKSEMIEELSEAAFTTRKQTEAILESLIHIIGREAVNGFAIPGLCKFEIVERKARKGRNPQTGESIDIPAAKSLKIRPLSRIKHAATAWLEDNPIRKKATTEVDSTGKSFFISCPHCERKLEADTSMAGLTAECPFCMKEMTVPQHGSTVATEAEKPSKEEYVLFSCPMCKQAIEASGSNAGNRMNCPVCSATVEVPESTEMQTAQNNGSANDLLGTTIRIDLP